MKEGGVGELGEGAEVREHLDVQLGEVLVDSMHLLLGSRRLPQLLQLDLQHPLNTLHKPPHPLYILLIILLQPPHPLLQLLHLNTSPQLPIIILHHNLIMQTITNRINNSDILTP